MELNNIVICWSKRLMTYKANRCIGCLFYAMIKAFPMTVNWNNNYLGRCWLSLHSSISYLLLTPRIGVNLTSSVCFLWHCFFLVVIVITSSSCVVAFTVRWAGWLWANHEKRITENVSLKGTAVFEACHIQSFYGNCNVNSYFVIPWHFSLGRWIKARKGGSWTEMSSRCSGETRK